MMLKADRLGNSLIHLNLRIGVSGVISREFQGKPSDR